MAGTHHEKGWAGMAGTHHEKETDRIRLQAGRLRIILDSRGFICHLADRLTHRRLDDANHPSPFVSLIRSDGILHPVGVIQEGNLLIFSFPHGMRTIVSTRGEKTHAVFEAVEVYTAECEVEALLWGPYGTSINRQVGEAVGVVCDPEFAIGIQALNAKTQGGVPYHLLPLLQTDSLMPDGYARGMPGCLPLHLQAAAKHPWGSTLQAFTLNAARAWVRPVGHSPENEIPVAQVPALKGPDARMAGSRIALFGCGTADGRPGSLHGDMRAAVLSVISDIERGEDLPHPLINGQWQKTADATTDPYFILSDMCADNWRTCLAHAKQAGIRYLYRDGVFVSDGHYRFHEGFGSSDAFVRLLVEEAEREGIRIGVHTMTGFVQGEDPYVTPIPDKRLLSAGASALLADVGASDTVMLVEQAVLYQNGRGRELRVGHELITYTSVEPQDDGSARITGCARGSFSTRPAAHPAGSKVYRLWPDAYGGLHAGMDMVDEVSGRLAGLFNQTGIRQISFDGSEDLYLTGHNAYAHNRFMDHFWFSLTDKENILNDGSNLTHHNWHMSSRMNWGEPWGEAMREGQIAHRYRNQAFFNRNFFPRMLGWFQLKENSPLVDIEWALSKSAGFDAGYALVTSVAILEAHPQTGIILHAVRQWEQARRARAFTLEQRKRLCRPELDWHLERVPEEGAPAGQAEDGRGCWQLTCLTPGQETTEILHPGAGFPWEPVEMALAETGGKRVEKLFLRDLIAKTRLVYGQEEDWIPEAWAVLEDALACAVHVSEDDTVSQNEIDRAVSTLTAARGQMARR